MSCQAREQTCATKNAIGNVSQSMEERGVVEVDAPVDFGFLFEVPSQYKDSSLTFKNSSFVPDKNVSTSEGKFVDVKSRLTACEKDGSPEADHLIGKTALIQWSNTFWFGKILDGDSEPNGRRFFVVCPKAKTRKSGIPTRPIASTSPGEPSISKRPVLSSNFDDFPSVPIPGAAQEFDLGDGVTRVVDDGGLSICPDESRDSLDSLDGSAFTTDSTDEHGAGTAKFHTDPKTVTNIGTPVKDCKFVILLHDDHAIRQKVFEPVLESLGSKRAKISDWHNFRCGQDFVKKNVLLDVEAWKWEKGNRKCFENQRHFEAESVQCHGLILKLPPETVGFQATENFSVFAHVVQVHTKWSLVRLLLPRNCLMDVVEWRLPCEASAGGSQSEQAELFYTDAVAKIDNSFVVLARTVPVLFPLEADYDYSRHECMDTDQKKRVQFFCRFLLKKDAEARKLIFNAEWLPTVVDGADAFSPDLKVDIKQILSFLDSEGILQKIEDRPGWFFVNNEIRKLFCKSLWEIGDPDVLEAPQQETKWKAILDEFRSKTHDPEFELFRQKDDRKYSLTDLILKENQATVLRIFKMLWAKFSKCSFKVCVAFHFYVLATTICTTSLNLSS